ncbi:MAG: type IV toxin-antitoxin system AbiEi family antitoxin domain-containing protein [Candidatus Nanopelagicales bacterium]|nr:type IV toxin-antitoxin system AbiEi family antitoxin domain-containing protein [Candidatus Nanopelagicales bacterium]
MNVRDRVLERAVEQHGYITTRDARAIGVDPAALRVMAARGRLERVGRGAYRVPVLPRTRHDDLAEAVAWTLGRGVVSDESALVLHGLSDVNPSRIHLTVPRANHPRGAGGELYRLHRRDLAMGDVTEVDDIPVTTVARTVRDCLADGTDPYQLRLALDQAEAQGELRRDEARALHTRIDERGTNSGRRA